MLAARRDDITAQLGQLSGVIEALAVPERTAIITGLSTPDEDAAAPIPENATSDLSFITNATTGTR